VTESLVGINGTGKSGTQRIATVFEQTRAENRAALIPYLTLGYPTPEMSLALAEIAIAGGADLIELGVPFSDPLADGPVIQRATHIALQQGMTVARCLEIARNLRQREIMVPFIFMGYYNPILAYGVKAFCRACYEARVDGLIVPDLPPEEGEEMEKACRANGLALIYLLAPTSTPKRIKLVAERSQGFVYLASVTGITGPRDRLPSHLSSFVGCVRSMTDKPLAVGFGVSTPEQAAQVAALADGVVVGSALVRLANESDGRERIQSFVNSLRRAVTSHSAMIMAPRPCARQSCGQWASPVAQFLTAGESHGPGLTAILEGLPAGLPLTQEEINRQLRRRQQGFGSGGRMRIEKDEASLTGGVLNGHTTGAPIAMHIENRDWANWRDKEIPPMTVPRPGHADLTGAIKYGYRELRLALERASARETAARVAVGALCQRLLAEFDVLVGSYVVQIGQASVTLPDDLSYTQRFAQAEESDVRCPDPAAASAMRACIREAMATQDTLGGIFEIVALGLPPGLGSHVHWDRRLDARLMAAVGSIQAIKGVEIGQAFENAARYGTKVHDEIFEENGVLSRRSNRAGGLEGGITTGQALVVRAAMKPISTTLNPLRSVDLATGEPATTRYERSDTCAVPRASVVGEAMVAFVLADALLEKLGGDSLAEMRPRFAALRRGSLEELEMDNVPWRLG